MAEIENPNTENSITIRGTEYTREICISDLKDIANEFPDKAITRDFFRKNTEIPEAAWTGLFGQFTEFQRQAGLKPTRLANTYLNTVARHAALDDLREMSNERMSYGEKYMRDSGRRIKTLIGVSDLHDEECDPFYIRVATDVIKRIQPDVVCLAGDIFDCAEFGKYHTDPRAWNPARRLKAGLKIIEGFREAAPDAQMDLIEGNHEARVLRYLSENAPAMQAIMSDVHGWGLQQIFGLDKYQVNYVARCDLFTFTETQRMKEIESANHRVYWNSLLAHHTPEGSKLGLPGFNGHHHSHEVRTMYSMDRGSFQWHQLGSGHTRVAEYCDGNKWNNGFMIAHVDTVTLNVTFSYVDVGTIHAEVGGQFYYRKPEEVYPALARSYTNRGKELCLVT